MRGILAKTLSERRFLLALACCFAAPATAVQLNNWRLPYYTVAAEMELLSASPSGMFWDDLGVSPLFDAPLRHDTAAFARNHWAVEPAYSFAAANPAPAPGRPLFWQLEVLNDMRYRGLTARQTLHADRRYDYDPLYPAHQGRFARGRFEEAYLQYDWSRGFARFGRTLRSWGPFIDRSLILSANPYSYDALEWQVHSSLFEFRHLFAALPAGGPAPGLADNLPGRFLAAHALNVTLGRWATFGITEAVLFRRETGFPDFQYVHPFSPYSVLNLNREGNGNLMLGFQWKLRPFVENVWFKGQLLLDDLQVDRETEGDREPSHWGIDAGVYWRDPLPLTVRHLLKAGYQRRSEWLYTVPDANRNDGEGYTYLSKGLGAPENDGDSIWAGISVIGKKWWLGSAGVSYARKGEKTDTSGWRDSEPGNIPGLPYDYLQKQFPSGIVQSAISIHLEGAAYYKNLADVRLCVANRWIRNKNHRESASFAYDPMVLIAVGIHFSGPFVSLPE